MEIVFVSLGLVIGCITLFAIVRAIRAGKDTEKFIDELTNYKTKH